jgi:hypothetical protein
VVGIVDIATYMCRIITAAVVIGIIIVDRGGTYRQMNFYTAKTTFEAAFGVDNITRGDFAGL